MRVIPNACAPLVLPEDCLDGIFEVGTCLLDIGMDALAAYMPSPVTGEPPCALVGFVAFGDRPQPDDLCNQLTVMVQNLVPINTRKGCIGGWAIQWRVEGVFYVYPGIIQDEDMNVFIPSVDAQETANRWLYAVGMSLAGAYMTEVVTPTCAKLIAATKLEMGTVLPSGPRGNCAGWNFTITTSYAGGI